MDLKKQYEEFKPTTIGELWSRHKTIDEILEWIELENNLSSEIIVEHLKKMKQ